MIKHVILWTLKEDIPAFEIPAIKSGIKSGLEGLQGQIPGLLHIHVQTECLASSNADVMLDSSFEDEDSLKAYSTHPAHVAVADENVRPYTATRRCMDYYVPDTEDVYEEYATFLTTTKDGNEVEMAVVDEFDFEGKHYVVSALIEDDTIVDDGRYIYEYIEEKEDFTIKKITKEFDYRRIAEAYIHIDDAE